MFLIIKIYNTYLIIIRYELYIPDYGKKYILSGVFGLWQPLSQVFLL